ncbi:SDR family NAD(P)-dependent oxidoreductase [Pedobacter frigiditerrae]|uniref:SDR family NAD(P)-dependent oxidoreductase n=1 Tax=Pedobacter frigiditerrae TaxID=2530452 RepID=UPI002930916C|nr:SDR family NAD(P)-dependent oxidoreductase [Pedobacter frigiditerrae]
MIKTVLITITSSGFGKTTAKLFAFYGWNVIAAMHFTESGEELNRLGNVLITRLDLEDPYAIQSAVKAGIERFGSIDAFVNNAGHDLIQPFELATQEHINKQYEVNVSGLMDVTHAVLPYLSNNGSGTIINVSLLGGIVALPYGSLYKRMPGKGWTYIDAKT